MARQRRKRNTIDRIKNDQGVCFEEEENIGSILTSYFSNRFTFLNPIDIEQATNMV